MGQHIGDAVIAVVPIVVGGVAKFRVGLEQILVENIHTGHSIRDCAVRILHVEYDGVVVRSFRAVNAVYDVGKAGAERYHTIEGIHHVGSKNLCSVME
ncbi:hypothetical protein SDC9_179856 [bioreactor metagenome]|uniref:Uncharacterized protein n=1 Tax=bioreactor metagenome TaxID=1076179 RepID=A0A645H067_9ZZZZ